MAGFLALSTITAIFDNVRHVIKKNNFLLRLDDNHHPIEHEL